MYLTIHNKLLFVFEGMIMNLRKHREF